MDLDLCLMMVIKSVRSEVQNLVECSCYEANFGIITNLLKSRSTLF